MRDGVLDRVPDVGVAAAQLGAGVERVKDAVADAVDDGINATKRAVKQGRRAVEDVTVRIRSTGIPWARSASRSLSGWDWEP